MGFPPAAAADDRFAPPTTPESVYTVVLLRPEDFAKSRNLILRMSRAGFEPRTSRSVCERVTDSAIQTSLVNIFAVLPYIC